MVPSVGEVLIETGTKELTQITDYKELKMENMANKHVDKKENEKSVTPAKKPRLSMRKV